MIITIESWHQLIELHHQKSIVEAKINYILNCINWLKSNEATEKSKEQISELKSERDDYLEIFSLIEQLSDLIYKSVSGCTTEETLIEIDVEIKSIKERIEEIIKKRLAK